MLELTAIKKQKVNLADFDCQRDIANRILLSDATPFELEVIEEILFSPLKISLKKLARNMECAEEKLTPLLQRLAQAGLLSLDGDQIVAGKEGRKLFEFEMARFDPAFKPDLDFIQGLLRKVPIHLLPVWYAIPRSSSNIFESIVEKYLLTPQIFQRYLAELNFADPIVGRVVTDLLSSPDQTLFSSDIIAKYNLTRPHFEEIVLLLEFHFAGYLSYRKEEEHWVEVITPFYEWHQYLRFLKETETPVIETAKVTRHHPDGFTFVDEMHRLLALAHKSPLSLEGLPKEGMTLKAVQKLLLLQLAKLEQGTLHALEGAKQWLEKDAEARALFLYRHPANLASLPGNERQIRETEKAIRRVAHGEWVAFDDFLKGVTVALGETPPVMIQRIGRHYRYAHFPHGEKEKKWLKMIIFEWLFEAGMVATASVNDPIRKDCFSVTSFGRFCFEE